MSDRNVFLIGPMGAGKSAVGRALARRLGLAFVDSDEFIEDRTGVDIGFIFEKEGEAGFRLREQQAIEELAQLEDLVLATGGGAVTTDANRETLARAGTVVYLRASVEQQRARVGRGKDRPMLQGSENLTARLDELMAQREPLYQSIADYEVETDGRKVISVVKEIEELLRPGSTYDESEE